VKYKIGDVVDGVVTGIQPYGAFVLLADETQGLIHVSEVQEGYTKNIHQFLAVGQNVHAQIIDIDDYTKKISLSMRTLSGLKRSTRLFRKHYFTNKHVHLGFSTIEQQLGKWTENALTDLAHHKEGSENE
jgi:general stress protein 13